MRMLVFGLLWEAWRAQRDRASSRLLLWVLLAGMLEQFAWVAYRLSHLVTMWESSLVPDLLQLSAYGALLLAIRRLPSAEAPWRSSAMAVVDLATAVGGAGVLAWFFLHDGRWVLDETGALGPLIEVAYPVLDVLILLMWMGRTTLEGGWAPRAIAVGLLLASLATVSGDALNVLYAYADAGDWAKQSGDFLTGTSSVGFLFAAVVARRYRDAFATALAPAQRSAVSQLVGAGLGLAVLLLLIAELEPVVDRGHLVLLLSVAGLGVLAVARLIFGARRNEIWYAERQRALEAEVQARTVELAAANARLATMVNQDPLTGLVNRRGFDEAFRRAWASGVRLKDSLAVLVVDVDRFKEYNDALGHPAGDACLRAIAAILKGSTPRASDVVARYGGEEFVILCPHTDAAGAVALAERIVAQMREAAMPHPNSPVSPSVTLSVGAAAVTCTADRSAEALLAAADAALYEAKRGGRDRAVVTLALPAA
jgi:diguanylate cyclase (GGDEF)-like protein